MKKFVIPFGLFILGIAVGFAYEYFNTKKGEETFVSKTSNSHLNNLLQSSFKFGPGKAASLPSGPVTTTIATTAIADYRQIANSFGALAETEATTVESPAGTSEQFYGFYIDAPTLKTILSDASLTGISFYLGKHPNHLNLTDKVLSIYFAGAKPNPTTTAGAPYLNSPQVYEYVDPCPTACGTLAPAQ